nr:MAG: hypothetical protein DIU67_07100 [Actinomycetota bacterium]
MAEPGRPARRAETRSVKGINPLRRPLPRRRRQPLRRLPLWLRQRRPRPRRPCRRRRPRRPPCRSRTP